MFRKNNSIKADLSVDNIQDLNSVLSFYKEAAAKDPGTLRLLIPGHEIWRFFIDGHLQNTEGWIDFEEREKGYLQALYKAYQEIFDFSAKLDIDFICKLHHLATDGVKETNYDNYKHRSEIGKFRTTSDDCVWFGLGAKDKYQNATLEGLFEYFERDDKLTRIEAKASYWGYRYFTINNDLAVFLRSCVAKALAIKPDISENDVWEQIIQNNKNNIPDYMLQITDYNKNKIANMFKSIGETKDTREFAVYIHSLMNNDNYNYDLKLRLISEQKVDTKVLLENATNLFIEKYEQDINKAKDPFEKLHTIVVFVQSCEQLHPFADANCRTFCMLLCNHLLMRNGFPPAIFDDPNRFDAYSRKELMIECIKGMKNTMNLIKYGSLYNLRTEDMLENMLLNKPNSGNDLSYFHASISVEKDARVRACKKRKRPLT